MKFISLAPHYYSLIGHGITYQSCLYKTCQSLGLSFRVLLPKTSPIENVDFHCERYFSKNVFKRFFNYAKIFNSTSEPTIFFIDVFEAIDLVFLIFVVRFLTRDDCLVLLIRKGIKEKFWVRSISKFLLKHLSRNKRTKFLTDSELISAQFFQTLGFNLDILPIPHTFSIKQSSSRRNDKIICYWPGEPRFSKGLKEMKFLSEIVDNTQFELIAAHSSKLKNAHLINDHLSREEYIHCLQACDIVLLPYDPMVYRHGTSGIFVETVCSGKLPLVKEGSWLAYELRKHELEELIVDWNTPNFFRHLKTLHSSPKIQEKLSAMCEKYCHFHQQEKFTASFATFVSLK